MSISRALNATALHARTAELSTTNLWIEDSGFTVPVSYTTPREEQWLLTERVALADLSARQVWSFRGADAASFLSFATLDDAAAMAPSRVQETYWCDDVGFVRGKGTLIRRGAADFELMTPVRDLSWMLDGAEGFEVEVRDISAERAAIGIAGPLAANLLAEIAPLPHELHAGDIADIQLRTSRVSIVALGEGFGFELLTSSDDAVLLWDRIWRSGRTLGLGVAGAAALDLVRIETGRLKPGVDWLPAQAALSDEDFRLPQDFGVEPNLARRFNGVDALRRRGTTADRPMAVQVVSDKPMLAGPLALNGKPVGQVTSVAWSEGRDQGVALAWMDSAAAKPAAEVAAPGPSGPVEARVTMVAPRKAS